MISPRVILFFFVLALLFIGVGWLWYWMLRAKAAKTGYNVYKRHEEMEDKILDKMTPYPRGHHSFEHKVQDSLKVKPKSKPKPKPKKKKPAKKKKR